jgi:hypothetical protein
VRIEEKPFRPDPPPNVLVFYRRPPPDNASTAEQLTESWIAAAKKQLTDADPRVLRAALQHALSVPAMPPTARAAASRSAIVLASSDPGLQRALMRSGLAVRPVTFTPFDEAAASKISHFETYNRTAAGQRVADLVRALGNEPRAILIGDGDAALPALLARAIVPVERTIVDVGEFDTSSDDAFVERLYIPGLLRAGGLQTAMSMATGRVIIHGAGTRFTLQGVDAQPRKLTAAEILRLLKN